MTSTRFCPVCGAANDETQTHCFACDQVLAQDAQVLAQDAQAESAG